MKKATTTFAALLFSAMLTAGAQAKNQALQSQTQSKGESVTQNQTWSGASVKQVKKEMIGMSIQDSTGDKLGEISDILFTPDNSEIRYALVSTKDLVGLAQDVYVVPWKVLEYRPAHQQFAADIMVDQFRLKAPTEESLGNREKEGKIFEFYGISPYWEEGGRTRSESPSCR